MSLSYFFLKEFNGGAVSYNHLKKNLHQSLLIFVFILFLFLGMISWCFSGENGFINVFMIFFM